METQQLESLLRILQRPHVAKHDVGPGSRRSPSAWREFVVPLETRPRGLAGALVHHRGDKIGRALLVDTICDAPPRTEVHGDEWIDMSTSWSRLPPGRAEYPWRSLEGCESPEGKRKSEKDALAGAVPELRSNKVLMSSARRSPAQDPSADRCGRIANAARGSRASGERSRQRNSRSNTFLGELLMSCTVTLPSGLRPSVDILDAHAHRELPAIRRAMRDWLSWV